MTTDELIEQLRQHPGLPVKVECFEPNSFGGTETMLVEIDRVQFSSASDHGRTCMKIVVVV